MNLNDKQLLFIDEYIKNGFNGRLAYKKAYPTCKSDAAADVGSCKLLKNTKVKQKLEEEKEELRRKSTITKEEILRDLKSIKDSNICDYVRIVKKTRLVDRLNYETGEMYQEEEEYNDIEYKSTDELTIEQQKNIKSIEMTKTGIKITLYDRSDAIEKLNKMLNFYNETINLDTRIDTSALNGLSIEDLMKIVEDDEE